MEGKLTIRQMMEAAERKRMESSVCEGNEQIVIADDMEVDETVSEIQTTVISEIEAEIEDQAVIASDQTDEPSHSEHVTQLTRKNARTKKAKRDSKAIVLGIPCPSKAKPKTRLEREKFPAQLGNESAAADLFSSVLFPKTHFPLPVTLINDKDYEKMSHHGAMFFASVNKLALKHETNSREQEVRLANSAKEVKEVQAKLDKELKKRKALEIEKQSREKTRVESIGCIRYLAKERHERDVEIKTLKRQVATEKPSTESKIKRAVKGAMRSMAEKFRAKMDRAKGKLKSLGGDSKDKLYYHGQCKANLEFIDLLQGDNPPDIEAEKVKIAGWEKDFVGADVEFGALVDEINSDLVVSPISADSPDRPFDHESYDPPSVNDGFGVPSSTNWYCSELPLFPPGYDPEVDMDALVMSYAAAEEKNDSDDEGN